MRPLLVVLALIGVGASTWYGGYVLGSSGLPPLLFALPLLLVGGGSLAVAAWIGARGGPVSRSFTFPAADVLDAVRSAAGELEKRVEASPAPGVVRFRTSVGAWSWGSSWDVRAEEDGTGTTVTATIHRRGSLVAPRTEAPRIRRVLDRAEELVAAQAH